METGDPLPPVRKQDHAVFRPVASYTSHHPKNVWAAVEGDGGARHHSAQVVSASAAQGGISADRMGAISMSRARRSPEMGGSSSSSTQERVARAAESLIGSPPSLRKYRRMSGCSLGVEQTLLKLPLVNHKALSWRHLVENKNLVIGK